MDRSRASSQDLDAIVVGAGPAGLACAQTMQAAGLRVAVLEKEVRVAASWRRHYDRLHLHTDRDHSGLPGMPMPRAFPTYPSRAEVVEYLESYAARFGIRPVFNTPVVRVSRDGAHWRAEANGGWWAPVVVIATGIARTPHRPALPGADAFAGEIIHSSDYRNAAPYLGKRVLVVGFGNSGAEIALDLVEAGVEVALSVRGPVQILPRDLLGIPTIAWSIFYRPLPARLVDFINGPVIRLAVGPIEPLRRSRKGPRQTVEEDGRAPVFDIGTLARIRDGSIKVHGAIDRLTATGAAFASSGEERFDAIILATGYHPDLRDLLPGAQGVLDDRRLPIATGRTTAEPGLYFCGQITSPTGQLREIGIEAARIAALVKRYISISAGISPRGGGSPV
jgi:cation diffusion facilitator CzcD-associated flavoprotein CzcO